MPRLDPMFASLSSVLNKIGAYVILPAITAIMTLDVALRYVFNAPLSWGLEASKYLLLVMFALGMVEAFRTAAHIRMDLLYRRLPATGRRLVTVVYGALAIGVFAVLGLKSGEEARFQHSISEVTQYLHLPRWLFAALISAVSALIVVFFILRLIAVLGGNRSVIEDATPTHGLADDRQTSGGAQQ